MCASARPCSVAACRQEMHDETYPLALSAMALASGGTALAAGAVRALRAQRNLDCTHTWPPVRTLGRDVDTPLHVKNAPTIDQLRARRWRHRHHALRSARRHPGRRHPALQPRWGATWREAKGPFDVAPAPSARGLCLGDYMGQVSRCEQFLSVLAMSQNDPSNRTEVFALPILPAAALEAQASARAARRAMKKARRSGP
jgi:hypothetical protein